MVLTAGLAAWVRDAHVLAMAVLLGGAALLWLLAWRARGDDLAPLLRAAFGYEALAWAATGVLVLTGVGNLGALAPGIPDADTAWGARLLVKLGLVLLLLPLSLLRTLLVARVRAQPAPTRDARRLLAGAYAGTTLVVASIATLGVMLAHG